MNLKSSKTILAAAAVFVLVSFICVGCKKKQIDPFPPSGAVDNWIKTTETRTYAAKDLWMYIDGEAEQYISAGVVTISSADYKFGMNMETTVEVYTMGTPDGARTILEKGRSKDAKTVKLGDDGIAYSQSLVFRKGTVLVRITTFEPLMSDKLLVALKQYTHHSFPTTQEALLELAHGVEERLKQGLPVQSKGRSEP